MPVDNANIHIVLSAEERAKKFANMFSRYFLSLCVLTLFVFSVSVSAQSEVKNEVRIDNEESSIESIEARLGLVRK